MLKEVCLRGTGFAARVIDAIAGKLGGVATLIRLGPRAYARRRTDVRASRQLSGSTFANGVTTTLTPTRAAAWHRVHWRYVVVFLYGEPKSDISEWLHEAGEVLRAHLLLAPDVASAVDLHRLHPQSFTIADGIDDHPSIDASDVLDWMRRTRRRWDLVFLDASESLPDAARIIELQHAAHEYHHDREVGFVTPGYRSSEGRIAGYDIDRRTGQAAASGLAARDFGQTAIPRYVLTAGAHGFYAASWAIDRVDVAGRHLVGMTLAEQVATLIRRAWAGNIRTLCLASTVLDVRNLPEPCVSGEPRRWVLERQVSPDSGPIRIIFVLNATSISGGIRIVFELANGLSARGFAVEIWSLQNRPSWFNLHVPVVTYRSYEDLLLSLRNEDAIKVATWWETAEVVWLASVNHGVPVYLVQEFETWFYPDDPVAQAAVVASYRKEMIAETEATYQREELARVGLQATLIPNGYDPSVFRPLENWTRSQDGVLALGRSFFQKNFAMTERAWRSLGAERPPLVLFGTEPDIMRDERVTYHERPSDAGVNELYNSAALFVQTSRHEGFCLPILEAMAAGCPVITTDSHGNRDFCRDGVNCVIVPQDDDVALAEAISTLLANPDERRRLATAGLHTAAAYRWSDVLDSVAGFHREISQAGASGSPFA